MECKYLNSSAKHLIIRNGLVGATCLNQGIGLFDFGNVIVQKDYLECANVRIISGGAHYSGDLVGKGMLTAAIQGDNFAAPASNTILRTLHELDFNNTMGSLIIVPCDTGNTLNFGLAIERALNSGLRLKVITVYDNYLNEKQTASLKESLGGIILLYKIAGSMSEEKKTLSDIYGFCQKVHSNMLSIEIDLTKPERSNPNVSCTCLDDNMAARKNISEKCSIHSIKVNLASLISVSSATEFTVEDCNYECEEKNGKLCFEENDCVVILLNNNMALSKIEAYFCIKDIVEYLTALHIVVTRVYVGNFMKVAFANLSVTLLKIFSPEVLLYLDSHCTASGWAKVNQGLWPMTTNTILTGVLKKTVRQESPTKGPTISNRAINILLFCMQFACSALISCEKQLNVIASARVNSKHSGDTGTRMKTLAELILKRMKQDKVVLKYPFTFFDNLSRILEKSLGGSTGCIYSILFASAANVFLRYGDSVDVSAHIWLRSFEGAAEALKRYGNTEYGDGTMYDPIYDFCTVSRAEYQSGTDALTAFGRGIQKAEEAVELTKKDKLYPDPGAHAVGIWMRAIYEGLKVRWPN